MGLFLLSLGAGYYHEYSFDRRSDYPHLLAVIQFIFVELLFCVLSWHPPILIKSNLLGFSCRHFVAFMGRVVLGAQSIITCSYTI